MVHFFSILSLVACTFAWFESSQNYRQDFNIGLTETNQRGMQAVVAVEAAPMQDVSILSPQTPAQA